MGQLLNWSLDLFNLTLESISSSGNVPSLSRYHCKCIFDEGSIRSYCLMVHCTKGQVGNVAENGKAGSGHLVHRLDAMIAEAFKQLLFKQVAGRRVRIQRQART
jgi:hypothetical protein